ncbi:polymeric immunoglobulin receptor-like [Sinocyclocheilus grahami]|uniref:polymeric immunoglobulin receptor-like n=1 Tax=Sinocyclocheilus grahami TaxID=75366 RepID=UPI0007AD3A81|nr:PREDICTED: polymeric immunoglobulin receptor-like [Sinocyclocheilus grahami]
MSLLMCGICYSSGSYNILTVKPGGSVTIPCYYEREYKHQKKYWHSEIDMSNTYTNTTEENLSVIDHPDQSLFTVTMRNLQSTKHDGHYYCTMKIEGKAIVTYGLYLQVQSEPDVSVVSSGVSGHEGGDISVQCFYSSGYQDKLKQWCRYEDKSCYTVGRTNTSQNSSVQISDDGRRSFTVLMTGLRLTDSGWYYCSAGEKLNPVHFTVIKAEPDKEKDTNNELLTVWLLVSAVLLLLLILISVLILFTWRLRRRPEQDKQQIREIKGCRTTDMIYSKPEDPPIYSTINDENPNDANKVIIYYSTIDDVPVSEAVKPPAGGAIYSTVAPH